MDKFKNSLLQILYSAGLVKESKQLNEEDIRNYIDELVNERVNMQKRADEYYGYETEVRFADNTIFIWKERVFMYWSKFSPSLYKAISLILH